MAQYDVDLRDYWRIIKKRKIILVLMVVLTGVSSYGFAKFKEPAPLYRAGSALKIEKRTNLASLLTGDYWFPSLNMDTHAYIITSFPVLVMTAKDLGWIAPQMTEDAVRQSEAAASSVERLKSMVLAENEKGTNIINIQATSGEADTAARVANTLAEAYRSYNNLEKNRKTTETKKFIEKQLAETGRSLKRAEADLQAFKEGYGLISVDAQTRANLDRLYSVEEEYGNTEIQLREAMDKRAVLEAAATGPIETLEKNLFAVSAPSPLFDLRNKLGDLFLERQNRLIDLTPEHPVVIEIDEKIRAVVSEMQKELQAHYRSLKTREQQLAQKLNRLRKENQSLPEKTLQLARLERELDLQATLYSQLKTKYQETLIQESGQVEEVAVVRPAMVPNRPFNIPSKMMIVVTGLVMGLIVGIVLAFGAELFDTSMGTIEDVEASLQVPVLGVIPYLGREEKKRLKGETDRARDLITHFDPKSLAAEAFRSLRTNLQFMGLEIKGKTFLITSSYVQEGKTLNGINLALSVAQSGDKVLLVEGDLRKPQIYSNFGLPREPGLTDFVLGNYDWKEVVNNIADVMLGDFELEDILKTPGMDNLHILTAGTRPPNPTEILRSERFRTFLTEAANHYDYIFIDAPPVLPVADASEIAPQVDGVILVYTVGRIGRGVLKRAKATLDNIDAKVLGIILNNVKPEVDPDYFKYNSQYYYRPDSDGPSRSPKNSGARVRADNKVTTA
jgi:succinoglycan biosynthesis transport protein ExoP